MTTFTQHSSLMIGGSYFSPVVKWFADDDIEGMMDFHHQYQAVWIPGPPEWSVAPPSSLGVAVSLPMLEDAATPTPEPNGFLLALVAVLAMALIVRRGRKM